ncbi:hypothetical protein JXA63_04180 [Candidatus Woesebacteria bacterium]|nr:hypothetical protein [Candidatus Woesebacteria bacterium]
MPDKKISKGVKVEKSILDLAKKDRLKNLFKKHNIQIFHDQNPNQKVDRFQEILNSTKYSTIKPPSSPWELKYKYKNSSGTTKIMLVNKFSKKRPSLIFHHGIASTRPIIQLRILADFDFNEKFNLFVIKASHHDSHMQVFKKYVNNFNNLASTIASCVIATDEIINFHNSLSSKKIIVAGFSMGGIITSLHYFYRNTADYYFSIIAYPNLGDILFDKGNKDFIHNYESLSQNRSIKKSFKIPDELKDKPKDKVFPILSEYDELIRFKKAQKFWKDYKVKSLDVGHFSVFVKRKEIREYILSKFKG